MPYDTHTFSTPIHKLYDEALATNNFSILEEFSIDHVSSVFHDYISQNTNYEFFPNTKFGPLLLQRISGSNSELDLYFFRPQNGLELCCFILDSMILDIFFEIMEPLIPSLPVTAESVEFGTPCSAEQEQMIRNTIAPILDQFPLTKEILFDGVINYPRRLYF